MTLADIRKRLAGLEGRAYWRSLEELSETPEFNSYINREFPAQASEFTDPAGRRQFLKLMGASLALAGVTACTRQPDELIVPYVRQPEEIVPGRPLFYATTMPLGGVGMPVLAENHMGRPTKLEGNPEHPASLGATDAITQAAILGLYDPDRSRTILHRGEVKTWTSFVAALQATIHTQRVIRGEDLRILTEPISSPSVLAAMEMLLAAMPQARWHQWDPVFGTVQGGAPAERPIYHLDRADVVLSLDADFLGTGPASVRYSKDFSSRRRIDTPQAQLNRLYAVEPIPTITGANADHRLALKSRDVHAFAVALAGALGSPGAGAGGELTEEARRWVPAVAADLQAHRGRSAIVAGDHQPAAIHELARMMNQALGNVGVTVTYAPPVTASAADGVASLGELIADMQAGRVDILVVIDANPVFTAPVDSGFAEAFAKVGTKIHLGLYHDETADLCHWHVPAAHFLESWGDLRAFDGTVSLQQPLIAPMYEGRTALELLTVMNGSPQESADVLVRQYWEAAFNGEATAKFTLHDRQGNAFPSFDVFWRHALHDGFIASTAIESKPASGGPAAAAPAPTTQAASPAGAPAPTMSGIEISFRPDPYLLDGRFANNAWLQEMPRPLSKITWDNVAYISPRTAERLDIPLFRAGNDDQQVIEIRYAGRQTQLPVWVLPGMADDAVAVTFGFGRQRAGRVGNNVGVNTFALRTTRAPWFDGGAEIATTGETYPVASVQNHFLMEGRHTVRAVTIDEYRADSHVVEQMGHKLDPRLTLYPEFKYEGYKWGMAIDLNSCTGCHACITACVAENNIPVVGKSQVMRSREMHWLRVDTYYEGDPSHPEGTYHQPVPCMQCENAPCEPVCPVAATVHSDEGLNDMVYNRCVGTRYCSNNCPYKVRRFNFMLYADFYTPELHSVRNPDVTIRSRGVMEKCTYCVQRINHARIDAKTEGRRIGDGEVKTACQQVCPADAIVFGDLNDKGSRVVQLKEQQRNYSLLEDLGTRPRTTYLAVVRNPNPALKG